MSDKTTAAIAAEQQTAAAEAPAEVLPAVTLDELEQVDLVSSRAPVWGASRSKPPAGAWRTAPLS